MWKIVGHYQKRVGTRLRKLKKNTKGLKGELSETIDKLQNYFGIALRSNCTTVKAMSNAILASFFHICSSKERSLHDHCEWHISNGTKLHVDGPGLSDDVIKW